MRNPSNPDSDLQDTGGNARQTPAQATDNSRQEPERADAGKRHTDEDVQTTPVIINRID